MYDKHHKCNSDKIVQTVSSDSMDQRLRKTERLTRKKDIDTVYRRGRRFSAKFFRIHVRENKLDHSRFTISISSRLCNAVLRNRWKRMLRESFRLNKAEIGPGLDIVAVPTVPPGQIKRPQVEFVMIQLVKKSRTSIKGAGGGSRSRKPRA